MKSWGAHCTTGAVSGGRLFEVECTSALKIIGLQTDVVEFAPRLMTVQDDDGGVALLRS